MTVTLPAWEAAVLAALAILGASTIAGLAMAAVIRKHPAPASPPARGTTPGAGDAAPQPQVPPKSPAPGFTSAELIKLTQIDQWAEQVAGEDPRRLVNAGALADAFRGGFGHLDDDDLGRLLLAFSVVARDYGLAGMAGRLPGTLALAAAELTRLTRTDVHLDHH